MASTLILAYLGQGTAAARPSTPAIATGTFGLYYATDTKVFSIYAGGAWNSIGLLTGGTTPTIVQSKMAVANSASITLSSAPTNGNLLVAMTFNPTTGGAGSGWTQQATNSNGTDFGSIFTKVAGVGESTTQTPLSGAGNGVIAMWELSGQNATPVLFAATQGEQAGLFATPPQCPTLKNALVLECVSLVSASNSIQSVANFTQDQIINTGTTRQGVMGHADATFPIGQPVVTFTGTGAPGNKSGIIIITA